jgi:hypothetical protein
LFFFNQDSTSSEIFTTLSGVTSSVIFSESNVTPIKVIFVVGVTALSTDSSKPEDINNSLKVSYARVPGKKFGNFLAQNLILSGTLAFYRIVNISNDQQMSLIITLFRSFNSSFQKCRLKIANRDWKMFHGELSAAVNKY